MVANRSKKNIFVVLNANLSLVELFWPWRALLTLGPNQLK